LKRQSFKNQRRNEDVRRNLSVLIRNEVKDSRVSPFCDVTGVDLSTDLQYCKVYVSCLGSEESLGRTIEGLKAAAGFLRRELAQSLNLRHTPELQFVPDHSVEYGSRMDALINKVKLEDEARPVGEAVDRENHYKEEEE